MELYKDLVVKKTLENYKNDFIEFLKNKEEEKEIAVVDYMDATLRNFIRNFIRNCETIQKFPLRNKNVAIFVLADALGLVNKEIVKDLLDSVVDEVFVFLLQDEKGRNKK